MLRVSDSPWNIEHVKGDSSISISHFHWNGSGFIAFGEKAMVCGGLEMSLLCSSLRVCFDFIG
jgi:hypothetical protein